jgi:hypothetical protein
MKRQELQQDGIYQVPISQCISPCKILTDPHRKNPHTGKLHKWLTARNLRTGREVSFTPRKIHRASIVADLITAAEPNKYFPCSPKNRRILLAEAKAMLNRGRETAKALHIDLSDIAR